MEHHMDFVFSRAEQYANMSWSFYQNYLQAEEEYKEEYKRWEKTGQSIETSAPINALLIIKETQAIAAIIFQALSIEAYTNLWGAIELGAAEFRTKYRLTSTKDKIKDLASKNSSEYPPEHLEKISALFEKRNDLVHSKAHVYPISAPSLYDYEKPENNYKDIDLVFKEQYSIFDGIDEQMILYQDFKENVRVIRNADIELYEEIENKQISEAAKRSCDAILNIFPRE